MREYLPQVNASRVKQFAKLITQLKPPTPLNFYSYFAGPEGVEVVQKDAYPPLHAQGVVDFFFFSALHNFGFWTDKDGKYEAPVYGTWMGKSMKGSDLLHTTLLRAWKKDQRTFHPVRLATISDGDFQQLFCDDAQLSGSHQFFATRERLELTRMYGRYFWRRNAKHSSYDSPEELVEYANQFGDPIGMCRDILTHPENGIPGFREDPLGKKAELLLMSLCNRPERFLHQGVRTVSDKPIVDYHDMRLTLRMGHITLPESWVEENEARRLTSYEREAAIRLATYRADELAIRESGLTRDQVDVLKWSARKFCPEMETPTCGACPLETVCVKRIQRLQPVLRTTFC